MVEVSLDSTQPQQPAFTGSIQPLESLLEGMAPLNPDSFLMLEFCDIYLTLSQLDG